MTQTQGSVEYFDNMESMPGRLPPHSVRIFFSTLIDHEKQALETEMTPRPKNNVIHSIRKSPRSNASQSMLRCSIVCFLVIQFSTFVRAFSLASHVPGVSCSGDSNSQLRRHGVLALRMSTPLPRDSSNLEQLDDLEDQRTNGKKRPRPNDTGFSLEAMSLDSLQNKIRKIRLEAIFHPKFENEKSNHEIRSRMLELVERGQGYLEVTLKHSGSLVLWSGGQRYYSKNSVGNQFTLVAEILLRQHFERAWRKEDCGAEKYQQLSRFIEKGRLTMAFEVVTAVLGDHGDIPTKDFLIVTAIADRSSERFYSTAEILNLCQEHRLPHNDTWAFTNGARELFSLYDSCRETGLATDTVDALTKTAQIHVASMYPHALFQGEILEGFIIRYLPYPDILETTRIQDQMQSMAAKAQEILRHVPPHLPPCFECGNNRTTALYQTDVRSAFGKIGGFGKGMGAAAGFVEVLESILSTTDGENRRKVQRFSQQNQLDLPLLTKSLIDSNDFETRRVADLLQTMANLNKSVRYTITREELPMQSPRTLCTINVLHDQTFLKYQREKSPDAMNLFRGFCVEMGEEESSLNQTVSKAMTCDSRVNEGPFLMLKMKLLPYMVRTFLCRNQLTILQQDGPKAFLKAATKMMESWSISVGARAKWIPFLEQWANYAKTCLDGTVQDTSLPPLTSFSYLKHLSHFTKQYESGKLARIPEDKKAGFRGLVCVVAPSTERAKQAAVVFSKVLDCSNMISIYDAAKNLDIIGTVCFGSIADHSKKIKEFLNAAKGDSSIVMYSCTALDIQSELDGRSEQDVKKQIGMCRKWDKQACRLKLSLSKASIQSDGLPGSKEFEDALDDIKKITASVPGDGDNLDQHPGIVVFFPGIPGCGKSSLLDKIDPIIEKAIVDSSGGQSTSKVKTFVGDEHGKNFWKTVKVQRLKNIPEITIIDKNTPPPSWTVVGDLCSSTRAFPCYVFPDDGALKTTRILGMRKPDGTMNPDKSHFYPFSLEYLALCLSRMLRRQPSTHVGKLDSGTPTAAMIVVAFYTFYRYKSAEELKDLINRQMMMKGTLDSLEPVRVPFFAEEGGGIPLEVEEILKEALQLQIGYDVAKKKVTIKDPLVKEMEDKLRRCFGKFEEELMLKSASLDESRSVFIEGIKDRANSIQSSDGSEKVKPTIKLVSIDVSHTDIHRVLREHHSNSSISQFLGLALAGQPEANCWENGHYKDESFVEKTHVTMVFWNKAGGDEAIKEKFGRFVGSKVQLFAKALLWDTRVAAFEVSVLDKNESGHVIPPCENEFCHVTIWVLEGFKASLSNELPKLVTEGKATRVGFAEPVPLTGVFSFWDFENNVISKE